MQILLSICGALLAIFIIILLHELGHFVVARFCGVKILRFSIGFGKALYTRIGKDGTEYVLAIFPLGGYVKMLGEHNAKEIAPSEVHRAFNRQSILARMAIVLAGPFTNFALALVFFALAYMVGTDHVKPIVGRVAPNSYAARAAMQPGDYILKVGAKRTYNWQQVIMQLFTYMGDKQLVPVTVMQKNAEFPLVRKFDLSTWRLLQRKPDLFKSLGMFPYFPKIPPVIKQVLPDSPAAKAGVKPGDRIVGLNGHPVKFWGQVAAILQGVSRKELLLTVRRGVDTKKELPVVLGTKNNKRFLGVMVAVPPVPKSMLYTERYNALTAWLPAAQKTWMLLKYNALVLAKLITNKLSFKLIGGPISILQAAGQASQTGIEVYLGFIGFISLAVGFINLLPVPGLDGGHFLFQVIEAIIRRPVSDRIQALGFTLGMLFVLVVVLNATINDLYRIFN